MDLPPAPEVAGTSLSGTETYVIDPEENRAICVSTGVPPAPDGTAHPVYFYIATQVAMGMTVAGLCKACDFDVEDGPMMGSTTAQFSGQIKTGEPYRVSGEIVSLTRKRSRKFGVMDILEYTLRLHQRDGSVVVSTTNTWALPRRHLA